MKTEKLELNHRYIVLRNDYLLEFQIIEISKDHYKVRWLSHKTKNETWIPKTSINSDYVIKEDLGLYITKDEEIIENIITIGKSFIDFLLQDSKTNNPKDK